MDYINLGYISFSFEMIWYYNCNELEKYALIWYHPKTPKPKYLEWELYVYSIAVKWGGFCRGHDLQKITFKLWCNSVSMAHTVVVCNREKCSLHWLSRKHILFEYLRFTSLLLLLFFAMIKPWLSCGKNRTESSIIRVRYWRHLLVKCYLQ